MARAMTKKGGKARRGVSRRDFLKGIGASGGALGASLLAAESPPRRAGAPRGPVSTLGPGPVTINLVINGRPRTARAEPRVTLLDLLRDRLDLTGAKKICDRGECGGCAVLVDGQPAYACMMLAVDARGKSITTVEGIAPRQGLHPVQAAFVEKDALQCGFCTPGFVVASKALLDRVPRPTPEQVRVALAGHICRCGTYPRIFEAVLEAARRPAKPAKAT
jgi:aerobic-type carbon monoxide dehydrogenase small subunit (CoxS/CutS family)